MGTDVRRDDGFISQSEWSDTVFVSAQQLLDRPEQHSAFTDMGSAAISSVQTCNVIFKQSASPTFLCLSATPGVFLPAQSGGNDSVPL